MAEKERQMNKKVNALSVKLRAEEEEVCILHWENMRLSATVVGVVPKFVVLTSGRGYHRKEC